MTTYMFPGQGSQKKGMGGDLFSKFPQLINLADEFLGYSIEQLCVNDIDNRLNCTNFTQPALYIVSSLEWMDKQMNGASADYFIGHSLGEYTALFAAGAYDFITGLQLVYKRGQIMAKQEAGAMLAVFNQPVEYILSILEESGLHNIDCANFNSPTQLVLSGLKKDIEEAAIIFTKKSVMCMPLNVNGAFHSRFMNAAADEFAEFIDGFVFNRCQVPVIANIDAKPYSHDKLKSNLINQIKSSVRWTESIRYLKGMNESKFIEIGPGNVLTRLLSQQ